MVKAAARSKTAGCVVKPVCATRLFQFHAATALSRAKTFPTLARMNRLLFGGRLRQNFFLDVTRATAGATRRNVP